jgi:rRNA maturation protein Nop10
MRKHSYMRTVLRDQHQYRLKSCPRCSGALHRSPTEVEWTCMFCGHSTEPRPEHEEPEQRYSEPRSHKKKEVVTCQK